MTGFVDAHQHFWRPSRGDYGWLTPALGTIHRDFEADDLRPVLARHGIEHTILVQAAPSEQETEYLLTIARRNSFVAGVVGWTDFEARDAAERITGRAEDPLIKGLRPMLQDLADDAWMLREDLSPAFRAVIAAGLRFDALVKPQHLPHLIRLVERHPDLPIVIDHGAKPDIAHWTPGDRDFLAWSDAMTVLASLGCCAKLSGLTTLAQEAWSLDDLRPYLEVLRAAFAPDRLMWGSDWPVLNLAGGYDAWRKASLALTREWDEPARVSLFRGSAARFYSLSSD